MTTAHGVDPASFVQDSQSRSNLRALRGLHTWAGRGEGKLVRCAPGAIHGVVVDARPGSPTFARHEPFQVDDEQFWHVFIPSGLLHGFQALSDVADVCSRIDREHDPRENRAVRYDDPDLAISWPLPVAEMSARDRRRVVGRAGQRDEQLTLAVGIPVGAASLAAELVHHLQLDPVVQRHLRLPSEQAAGTIDSAMGSPDIAGLRRQVPRDQRSADVFRHQAQQLVDSGG